MTSLIAQSMEVIPQARRRSGHHQADDQRQGADRVLVQVPGFADGERLKSLISKTARLEFHLVHPTMSAAQANQGIPSGYYIVRAPMAATNCSMKTSNSAAGT